MDFDRTVAKNDRPRCEAKLTANAGAYGWVSARCEYELKHRGLHYHGKAYWGTEGSWMQDLDDYREQLREGTSGESSNVG